MLLTAVTAEGKKMVKHQYYLLAPGVVTIAILKLSLIILPFGAYVSNQSTNGGVRQNYIRKTEYQFVNVFYFIYEI